MNIDDKIRKLLAVAECESASDAERATALHQAARLAEKHSIDIDALGKEATQFGATSLAVFAKRVPGWVSPVNAILNEFFNVRIYRCRRDKEIDQSPYVSVQYEYFAFGCLPSRSVAVYVFVFLSREFHRLALLNKSVGKVGFYRSLAIGLCSRMRQLKDGCTTEERGDMLIVSGRLESVFKVASEGFGNLPKPRGVDLSREAYELGKQIEIKPALAGDHVLRIEN